MPGRDKETVLRRIVVLGHDGFIGRHLMHYLGRARPDAELLGRSYPGTDLTRTDDALALADLIDSKTAVVMCSGIKKQHGDTLDTFGRNIAMAVNVGRLVREAAPGRLVFFSTADVYGEEVHDTAISEETPVRPTSFYGMAKLASEWVLRKTAAQANLSLAILRMPFVYGPGDQSGIYGPLGFLRAALDGEPIALWGDGTEQREFLYVLDLARVVEAMLGHDYEGVLNVASGLSHTFREAVDIIGRLMPAPPRTTTRPRSKNKVDVGFDTGLLGRLLPGFAFTPFEEGIRQILQEERTERARKAPREDAG